MTPQTGYSYEQVLAALKKTEGESRRQLFLEVGDIGSVSGQQQQTNANLDVLPRRLPCKIAVYLRHYRDIRRYHADELNDALEMLSYEFRMLVSREQLALIRRTTHATVIEEALRPDDMPGRAGSWPTGPVQANGQYSGADHWKKAQEALRKEIAHVVDPVSDHRLLPARIDVLEQIAHFLYDNETVDRRGEVRLTEPDEKVATITGTPKNVLALVAETVTAARGAYGEISWTLDGIDRTGARIVVHSPQSETISDTLRSNWVADRKPPEPKLATVKAHQSNRRVVQKLISEALRHQDKRPIWNGTPYQTRITGFTLTAAGE